MIFKKWYHLWRAQKKILGVDARDVIFVSKNSKHAIYLADSKLASKIVCKEHKLLTSKVIAIIYNRKELQSFDWNSLPDSFVLKPNRGLGGAGIVVAYRKKGDYWLCSGNRKMTIDNLKTHIVNIFEGTFSLFNQKDIAFFEERITVDNYLKPFANKGIPDIRIWLYNYVPIMAMLRLPSASSDGKANLAMGGIGVGLDLATGQGIHAIIKGGQMINAIKFKKGSASVYSIKIPKWKKILKLAIETAKACKIKFTGLDIAIDKNKGPLVLEVNARPGLEIQNANMAPVRERLERVANLKKLTTEKALNIGISLFGNSIEEEIENLAGKEVIGINNKIEILDENGKPVIKLNAKIDSGIGNTVIDDASVNQENINEALKIFKEYSHTCPCNENEKIDRWIKNVLIKIKEKTDLIEDIKIMRTKNSLFAQPICRVRLKLSETEFSVLAVIAPRHQSSNKVILGQDALKYFLLDVSKK